MTGHEHHWGTEVQTELRPLATELRRAIPDVLQAFAGLSAAAMAPGALDGQTKELIAFAIAITEQCDGCIAAHARSAVRKGISREQVAEMIGVTILMNGGPATVYGPRALDAFDDYSTTATSTTATSTTATSTTAG
jgi:AhpD family alkylhydroperoxidase